jgi:preprotein translocase subunit SecA
MQPVESEMETDEFQKKMLEWQKKHDEVIELGGLYVIGTERHESRRIDNQLRGRSGRQGDPGKSKFYVSLEDDLMRIFGGEQISRLMTFFNLPEDQPLSHPMVSRAIEQAQIKVEGFNFDIRKRLVEYDDVLNKQRDIIYALRRKFLMLPEEDPEKFKRVVFEQFNEAITQLATNYFAIAGNMEQLSTAGEEGIAEGQMPDPTETLVKDFEVMFPGELPKLREILRDHDEDKVLEYLNNRSQEEYEKREEKVGSDTWNQVVRSLFLSTVDQNWTKHLTAIDDLREGINLRGYAQLDPLVEYKNEAFRMFEELISGIKYEFTRRTLHIQIDRYEDQKTAPQIEAKPIVPEQELKYQAATGTSTFQMQSSNAEVSEAEDFKPVRVKHSNKSKKKKRKKRNRK